MSQVNCEPPQPRFGLGATGSFSVRNPCVVVVHDMARAGEGEHLARIEALAGRLGRRCRIVNLRRDASREEVQAAYCAAHVLITRRLPSDAPPLPRLRLLQVPASGYDMVDVAALPSGSALCILAAHEIAMAEYAFAMMLEWSTSLSSVARAFRRGRWSGSAVGAPPHRELFGKTLSILGFGRVGAALALRASAFGMRVEALTRSGTGASRHVRRWYGPADRTAFLGRADFLVLACPLDDSTRGMVDAAFLAALPSSAVLVNLARAGIVDEAALYDALRACRLAGAVIDVWWRYPAADDPAPRPSILPFHALPNVIMTPHLASWTDGVVERRWQGIAHNLERLLSGRPLKNVIVARMAGGGPPR